MVILGNSAISTPPAPNSDSKLLRGIRDNETACVVGSFKHFVFVSLRICVFS